jgi:hypothetical protein
MTTSGSDTPSVGTEETLPFSNPKQEALMGWLLMDSRFFLAAKPRIQIEWWGSMRLQGIWGMLTPKGGGKNKEHLGKAFAELKRMSREIDDATFEQGTVEEMRIEDIEAAQIDATQAVDFGLPKLNDFLNPEGLPPQDAVAGKVNLNGLLKGDMTVLLAPTNVGKTTTMVTSRPRTFSVAARTCC